MKPCPFCGEQELEPWEIERFEDTMYRVYCTNCGALGPDASSWKKAVKEWDNRKKEAP